MSVLGIFYRHKQPTDVHPSIHHAQRENSWQLPFSAFLIMTSQLPPAKASTPTILTQHIYHPPTCLCGVIPLRCNGEFSLHNVTFAYPSRPIMPVLSNISIYLPARETTLFIGGSGSAKLSLTQLLHMYTTQSGCIQMDDQDLVSRPFVDAPARHWHCTGLYTFRHVCARKCHNGGVGTWE